MASGLGSIDAGEMATDLQAYTRAALVDHGTKITSTASKNPLPPGGSTVLSGKLVDTTTHTGLGSRLVIIQGTIKGATFNPHFFLLHTGKKGGWSLKLTRKQMPHKFTWRVMFLGEQGHRPAISPTRVLGVPPL